MPTQSLIQNPPCYAPKSARVRAVDSLRDATSTVPTIVGAPIPDPGSILSPSGKAKKGAGAPPPSYLLLPKPARVYHISSEGFIRRKLNVRESGGRRIVTQHRLF